MDKTAFEDRPLVYVAGPYQHPDPVENTNKTIAMADTLNEFGLVTAHVPHLTLLWHMVLPHDVDYWYEYDMSVLVRCDALFRMKGASSGADNEILKAEEHKIPVFHDVNALHTWAKNHAGV